MSPSTEARSAGEFASELKFLVDPDRASRVREWAAFRLELDPNADSRGQYRIASLYLESQDFDVYRRNGSFARSKYRVRRYGRSEQAFLERKLKTNGRVGKIRTAIGLAEIGQLRLEPSKTWPAYWFQRRLDARGLSPVCQISYLRTAHASMTASGPIRLTVDEDIHALPVSGYRFDERERGLELSRDLRIVEIKFRGAMPALFKEAIERFLLVPAGSSKYRQAVDALGIAEPACMSC